MSTPDDGSRRIGAALSGSEHPDVYPNSPQPIRDSTALRPTPPPAAAATTTAAPARGQQHSDIRPAPAAKTSAAAVFALVFGLAALFCALTAILSPAALVFGIIGLVLAVAGLKMAKRPGITGKSVAMGGLVTAVLGLILGGVVIGGLATVLNNKTQLDRIQSYLSKQEAKLPKIPSADQVRSSIPTP